MIFWIANVKINNIRSNYVFGEVDDDKATWLGIDDGNDENKDEYSEFDKNKKVFEPREISLSWLYTILYM